MFHSVVSTDAQRAMLDAAAAATLTAVELDEFNSLMTDFRSRYRERSRLVHNSWGESNDHPDKALWCRSSDLTLMMANILSAKDQADAVVRNQGAHIWAKCMAYTVKDLQDVNARLELYTNRVLSFTQALLIAHPVVGEEAKRALEKPQKPQ